MSIPHIASLELASENKDIREGSIRMNLDKKRIEF